MEVELERNVRDYIHNDIANAAHHLKKTVERRMADNDRDGIFLDMMASLTMIAFAVEANLNFIGAHVVQGWVERQPGEKKWTQVLGTLGIEPDYNQRPFSTIEQLRQFRDTLAHGKPRVLDERETAIGTYDELYSVNEIKSRSPWEHFVTLESVHAGYDDMNEIWNLMLERAGIALHDTLSGWSGGMTYKRDVD
jgi:hypothetical protein